MAKEQKWKITIEVIERTDPCFEDYYEEWGEAPTLFDAEDMKRYVKEEVCDAFSVYQMEVTDFRAEIKGRASEKFKMLQLLGENYYTDNLIYQLMLQNLETMRKWCGINNLLSLETANAIGKYKGAILEEMKEKVEDIGE